MKLIPYNGDLENVYKKTKNLLILEEFMNSKDDCVMVEDYPHKSAHGCANALIASAKRFGFNVTVLTRKEKVFMVKNKGE